MSVSRLKHITRIGVEQMGDLADSLDDDEVLRLENLETELKPVFEELNIHIGKLPIINATHSMLIKRQHTHFKDYYDSRTINAIADRYQRDIELFDYEF